MKILKRLLTASVITLPLINATFAANTFKDSIMDIFSNDYIFTILLVIAIVGAVIEILTPGFGVGGLISVVSFGIFFWGNIMAGNSNWYALILFIAGILLLGFEIIIPGFGICGVSGILAMVVALVIAMGDLYFAVFSLAIAIVISIIIGIYLFRKGIDSEVVNRLRLFTTSNTEQGYISVSKEEIEVGDILKTSSVLRPTGFAYKDGNKIEVISESGYIENNIDVIVTRLSGPRIYVKESE